MAQPSMYQESLRAFLKPILKYLDDDACSEIMINGPTEVWIESKGKVIDGYGVFPKRRQDACVIRAQQIL